jgi:hypothetical protein
MFVMRVLLLFTIVCFPPLGSSLFRPLQLGYGDGSQVVGAHEYDKAKEKAGFVAGKHIHKPTKWWFQGTRKEWNVDDRAGGGSSSSHGRVSDDDDDETRRGRK